MSKVEHAVHLIEEYGAYDGQHHKQWLLDQLIRTLLGDQRYEGWIENRKSKNLWWDEGIAP